MKTNHTLMIVLAALTLSACATNPTGPSNMALPGTGKDFNRFRADDLSCRDFALTQIGGKTVNQQYNASLATTTAVGTVIGAAVGAAAGGGQGAAIGAGMGALSGGAIGSNTAAISGANAQDKYDNGYYQCMYAAGHRIPVPASMARTYSQSTPTPAATSSTYYPPPPPPPTSPR
ncbi:YMGG-like glycine zipper-containing protein [Methylophilus sp. 5]|uniref:YMGG-like glycine zipper-containing protein n=1 Tax=Methylophilus sp. 5 TaxID=1112274 RepID=UPI00048BE0A6|nr:YMGG-like glycine zipper-containing protein [Methylophilus sp. 5]